MGRLFLLAVAAMGLTGCMELIKQRVQLRASGSISCPPEEIVVSDKPGGVQEWVVDGCGRQSSCDYEGNLLVCEETADSKHRTLKKVVVDRLALETNCPAPGIHVDSESSWSRGDEHAYRMTACGAAYVCTTAAGRTDCKAALAAPAAATR